MHDSTPPTLKQLSAVLFIVALFVASAVSVLHDISLYTPDSARYMIWAKSLASFEGYKDATGPEVQRYVVHAPLYALLLAPVAMLFPSNLVAAKAWTMMFGVIAIVLAYFWLRGTAGERAGRIGAFLLATNALFLLYATEVLSDVPFLGALILFFVLNDSLERASTRGKTLALAAVVACGLLIREVGIALLVSQLIYSLVRREGKRAIIVLEVAVLAYLLWLVRNEWIVASRELPSLTNSRLFLHHFFTSADESIAAEFIARIGVNLRMYAATIGGVLFYPMYGAFSYDLLFRLSPSYVFWMSFVQSVSLVLLLLTAAGVAGGAMIDWKRNPAAMLKFIFLAVYIAIILCYPINDIRFMLPVALVGIYYCALAAAWAADRLAAKGWKAGRIGIIAVMALLAIPNLIWMRQYASANQSYHAFFSGAAGADTLRAGGNFARPTGVAADWIRANTPGDAVLMSQIKDLGYAIGERKLINVNETVSLDNFEYYIRDYRVRYVVSAVQSTTVPEFQFQMHQSRRYAFYPVHRIGNLIVYQIGPKPAIEREGGPTDAFTRGLTLLNEGKYREAGVIFNDQRRTDSLNYAALFYSAVAEEFAGNLEAADAMFASFMYLPQSGMYLDRSGTHREIIRMLNRMDASVPPVGRAEQYSAIAASYWEMGFREQAKVMLETATAMDSTCYSAALFTMYFSLEQADTAAAKRAFLRAKDLHAGAKAMAPMMIVFACFDSLATASTVEARHGVLMTIAEAYSRAGLAENAIDTYRTILREDPGHIAALNGLATVYEAKRRFAPALAQLHRIAALTPGNAMARQKIEELNMHF